MENKDLSSTDLSDYYTYAYMRRCGHIPKLVGTLWVLELNTQKWEYVKFISPGWGIFSVSGEYMGLVCYSI